MGKDNQLRPITENDLRFITTFLDFVCSQETRVSEDKTFEVPGSLVMPLTEALNVEYQKRLMLELFNTEPHHSRMLAVRNAQDENVMLIPGAADIRKEMEALKPAKK